MHVFKSGLLAVALMFGTSSLAMAIEVTPGDSTEPWLGFMNVSNLPAPDGDGAFQFGSGWGVADLVATFDDANGLLTLTPNTIGDPNEYWYQNTTGTAEDPVNPGGPGQAGNKVMEANLYIEETDVLNGQTVDFTYNVVSDSTTSAHEGFAFIRDFAPDYSSFNETISPLSTGGNTISLATDPGAGRHVQYGFQFVGVNVWVTDTVPFGSIEISTLNAGPTAGDFNGDGFVNAADYTVWRDNLNSTDESLINNAGIEDGVIDSLDYGVFQMEYTGSTSSISQATAIPEPSSVVALLFCVVGGSLSGLRKS